MLPTRRALTLGVAAMGAATAARARAASGSGLGVQLFSLSFLIRQGPEGMAHALEAAKAIGFQTVEPAGLGGLDPATLRRMAQAQGLAIPSLHMGNDQVLAVRKPGMTIQDAQDIVYTPEGVVQVARTNLPLARDLGCRVGVVAASGRSNFASRETVLRLCEAFNTGAKLATAIGLELSYHMHAPDFARIGDDTAFDLILTNTDPAIRYQLDVCWAAAAGVDPAALIRTHAGRLVSLHLKDLAADRKTPLPAGRGVLDFRAIREASRAIRDPLFYVEGEGPPGPAQAADVQSAYSALAPLGWGRARPRAA